MPDPDDIGNGSLAFNSSEGEMYIKDRIGWQIFPSDEKLVHLGCDTKASTMSIGTKDSYSFELITNEKVAMVLDKDGNATFSGTVTLGVMT